LECEYVIEQELFTIEEERNIDYTGRKGLFVLLNHLDICQYVEKSDDFPTVRNWVSLVRKS